METGNRPQAAGAAPLWSSPVNGAQASRQAAPATLPFRGAKHFPTAAPTVLRWESAFALLSHRESNKEVTSAEAYGIIKKTGGASIAVKISGMMGTGSMGHCTPQGLHQKARGRPVTDFPYAA